MRYWILCFFAFAACGLRAQNFYDINAIREVKIQFEDNDWDKKLVSLRNTKKKSRLTGNITIDGKKYEQVGVRYKGNSSYNATRKEEKAKLPLNVESDYKLKKQDFGDKIETLKLSNMFRDPSYIREVLAYWLANQLVVSPSANFAKVTVNKTYLGVYTSTESIDSRFLKNKFGDKNGIFFKCDPDWDSPTLKHCPKGDKASLMWQGPDSACYNGTYELKNKSGYKELLNLISILDKNPSNVSEVLDVDKTLWMHAFNHVIVNLDSYTGSLSHNYYLYRDSSNVFVPLLWDLNLAFGGFRLDGKKNLTDIELFEYPLLSHSEDPSRPLISKLLSIPLYKKIYLAHCRYIYENFLVNDKLEKEAERLSSFIEPDVKKDVNNLYSFNDFKQNLDKKVSIKNVPIVGVTELIRARKAYLQNFYSGIPKLKIDSVFYKQDSTGYNIYVKTEETAKPFLFYKNEQHPRYNSVQMQEDKNLSTTLGGKCFVFHLPAYEKTYYYVVLESEKVAQVFPARASNEPLKIPEK